MSASKDYIPGNSKDFNDFQLYLVAQVVANAAIWNIPAAIAATLTTMSTDFVPINAAIVNEETRSRAQMIAYRAYRQQYDAYLRNFCQSFLTNNSVIPIELRKAMGLNPRGLNPRTKRVKIGTAPIVSVNTKGGGEVKFGFKVESSNKRTGRHPESNGVNVFYRIVTLNAPVPPPPPILIVPTGDAFGGASPDENSAAKAGLPSADGFDHAFSTKATFTRQLPLSEIGKVLHVYAQWVNTTDPGLNSTFSTLATVVIS
jgi:hypothetical protein